MRINSFFTGVVTGVVVGSALSATGSMLNTRKGRRVMKRGAGHVLHVMGDVMDNVIGTIDR